MKRRREKSSKKAMQDHTEAIRQAILAYKRMIEEEELNLVHKAVEIEMLELDAGKVKTCTLQDIKKIVMHGR